jgi:hypothetical protein
MVLIVLTALIGAGSTFAALLPFGIVASLLGAPFGGSFAALLAGILIAALRTIRERSQSGATWTQDTHSPLLTRRF